MLWFDTWVYQINTILIISTFPVCNFSPKIISCKIKIMLCMVCKKMKTILYKSHRGCKMTKSITLLTLIVNIVKKMSAVKATQRATHKQPLTHQCFLPATNSQWLVATMVVFNLKDSVVQRDKHEQFFVKIDCKHYHYSIIAAHSLCIWAYNQGKF